jgi:hypothetical protein
MRTHRASLLFAALCLLAVQPASAAESPSTKADDYRNALHGTISLQLAKAEDGGNPTLELAIAWICKKVEVPYQVKRSRELCGDKVKARISPINYTDVVAGRAVLTLATQAGLVPKIDDNGVYLTLKQGEAGNEAPPPTTLTVTQRLQLGQTLQVEVKALQGKDVDRYYWGDKDVEQKVQLSLKITATQAFASLKIVPHLYAHIQRHSRDSSDADDDSRPRYGPNKDFVELLTETIMISGLPRMEPREVKTKAASTAYSQYDTWSGVDRRYGEKYYGCIVDFYVGDQLIKSVASTTKLFELTGRDTRTGFPLQ